MFDNGAHSEACPPLLELASYLDGRLAADARMRVEAHLARCDDCLEAICETRTLMSVPGTPDVRALIVERARSLRSGDPPVIETTPWRIGPWLAVGQWGVAAAAAIALCLFSYRAGTASAGNEAEASDEFVNAVSFGAFDLDDELSLELEAALLNREGSR